MACGFSECVLRFSVDYSEEFTYSEWKVLLIQNSDI